MTVFPSVTYRPGEWVAIAGPTHWMLVDLAPDDPTIQTCWEAVSSNADLDTILDALVQRGIRAAPGFVVVHHHDDGDIRVLVRGDARIDLADGSSLVADPRSPWIDSTLSAMPTALTGGAAVGGVSLPLESGAASASQLCLVWNPQASVPLPAEAGQVPESAQQIDTVTPVSVAETVHPTDPGAPADRPDAVSPTAMPSAADATSGYDHLFAATIHPDLLRSEKTSRDAERPPDDAQSFRSEPTTEHDLRWAATAAWRDDAADVVVDDGVIDALPPFDRKVEPDAPRDVDPVVDTGPPVDVPDEQSVEHTVNRALLNSSPTTEAPPGPAVLAGYCPNGHLSAPHADVCRVCRAVMPPQQAFEVTRPALGMLRLSTGDTVTLDRGVLFGRSPVLPEGVSEMPNAVRLASPGSDISRNHAEIELDGWNVYVRDLNSTNGTVVALPGRAPVRLHPHDPYVLEPGAQVTLADVVSFVFEVTA